MRNHSLLRARWAPAALALLLCTVAADHAEAAEIPPHFKRLIAQGKVEFEFYDPRAEPQRYPGKTFFLLYVKHRYRFRYDFERHDGSILLKIQPFIRSVKCCVSHKIRLPERFNTDDRWSHWLVAHEFDHVAISTDPRPAMLVERLLRKLPPITQPVGPNDWEGRRETIDTRYVGQSIESEIDKRRGAVQRLMQANYELLDELTRHGVRPLPERQTFFKSLYGKTNLEQMRFPYTAEVSDLLKSRAYQNAALPYEAP